jgi:predicted transcriptional regulator
MKLSKTEEEVMQHIWRLENAFMKDILEAYEEPKPATTTIATLLKRIRDKGFIDYETFGKARKYYPLVSKSDYFGTHFRGLLQNFFGNSASRFASFFTQSTDLSKEELEALRAVIDEEIKKKGE